MDAMNSFFVGGNRFLFSQLVVGLLLAGAVVAQPASSRDIETTSADPASRLLVVGCGERALKDPRLSVEAAGATVLAHLGPCRWLVSVDSAAILDTSGVGTTRPWRSADAVSPELRGLVASAKAIRSEEVLVTVALAPETPTDSLIGTF